MICGDTTSTLDALPQPPEQITVTDFATSAASALDNESERSRSLQVPDELAADHRAFVRNTDEQAEAWREIATVEEGNARFGELTVLRRRVDPRSQRPRRRDGCRRMSARRGVTPP